MICRFTGHTKHFYSVAEHCVRASLIVPPEYAAEALLHDASEAYLCDIARPVKHHPAMNEYREAERRLEKVIAERYGVPYPLSAAVKDADNVMLLTEKRDLMAPCAAVWNPIPGEPHPTRILSLSPYEAEGVFLERFQELFPAETVSEMTVNQRVVDRFICDGLKLKYVKPDRMLCGCLDSEGCGDAR